MFVSMSDRTWAPVAAQRVACSETLSNSVPGTNATKKQKGKHQFNNTQRPYRDQQGAEGEEKSEMAKAKQTKTKKKSDSDVQKFGDAFRKLLDRYVYSSSLSYAEIASTVGTVLHFHGFEQGSMEANMEHEKEASTK
jgi:hypothetical protein